MNTKAMPAVPSWVPEAVRAQAQCIYESLKSDSGEAAEVWTRLVTDPRMKKVWVWIYRRTRIDYKRSQIFAHPTTITYKQEAALFGQRAIEKRGEGDESEARSLEQEAKILERLSSSSGDQWCTEQDLAAAHVLLRAFWMALDLEPLHLADYEAKKEQLRGARDTLETQLPILLSLGLEDSAEQLKAIIASLEERTTDLVNFIGQIKNGEYDPWIIQRKRNDSKLRAFVARMSLESELLFNSPLHGIVAILASVALKFEVDRDMVRGIMRTRDVRKR